MKPKSNRLAAWSLCGLVLVAVASCNGKKEDIQPEQKPALVSVSYAQTQCADRWGQAQSPAQLEAKALAYLAQLGLTLHQPRASAKYPAALCNACSCPTGLVLEATVSAADLPAVLALGFKE